MTILLLGLLGLVILIGGFIIMYTPKKRKVAHYRCLVCPSGKLREGGASSAGAHFAAHHPNEEARYLIVPLPETVIPYEWEENTYE